MEVEGSNNARAGWLKKVGTPPGLTDVAICSRKGMLKLPPKSKVEEYRCGKARLMTMLEDPEDPAVRSIQPFLRAGRKWKVEEAFKLGEEGLIIKEVIGLTQTGR
ncbi:polyprotein [Plakobranchus ocellatus]|uniref:Polyprotein n=1 Tax=Plakobranchus ocellatus TaxID=259542 RepID=A0AAV4DNN1_9GAST|nr:polyprotein [Plakobranchus ocellatus]